MRYLINTLAVSAIVLGSATFAQAADAIDEIPAAPESQDLGQAPTGWDGAYLGAKATYQWGKVKPGSGYDASGAGAGIYGGYNLQDGQLVYGAEADVNYSGIDAEHSGVKTKQGLNGSLRARLGYDVDPALVYGTAGLAATKLNAKDATSDDSKTALGLTLGAGVETKLTDTITARTEYRFTNYQDQTFQLNSGTVDRGLKEHSISLGLGVKF